ncbi:MAG TPA: hypothetical protein VNS55_03445 [Nocardioides sp.]|nr:hypothetical protein [Nocardioides sp.]
MTNAAGMSQRPLVAFLDMNVWIDIARGRRVGDSRWVAVFDGLLAAVAEHRVVLPLISSHYLELWNRSDQISREGVATVMRDLSSYVTLAPIQDIRRREVAIAVERYSHPEAAGLAVEDLLGHGVNHAFNSSYGRFRFVESLASTDGSVAEGPSVPAPDSWTDVVREGPAWEWINLAGLDDVVHNPGLERTPTHRLGTAHVQEELRIRELIGRAPWARTRIEDIVVTEELQALTDSINAACRQAGVDPYALFLDNPTHADPSGAMRGFVRRLPSVDTAARLRVRKHQDLSHPWEQHDRVDIISLATAVPYCDVVVTERRWVHLIQASRLAADYKVRVGSGIGAVESLVSDA